MFHHLTTKHFFVGGFHSVFSELLSNCLTMLETIKYSYSMTGLVYIASANYSSPFEHTVMIKYADSENFNAKITITVS